MATCARRAHERTALYLSTPALWAHWPFLPVVRRSRGVEELGVVFDARAAGLTGFSSTVFAGNIFLLPDAFEQFLRASPPGSSPPCARGASRKRCSRR